MKWLMVLVMAGCWGAEIETRGNEIFDGARQITRDGCKKDGVVVSPKEDRIAYVEDCGKDQPSIVVIDARGRRIGSAKTVGSGMRLAWSEPYALRGSSHISPEGDELVEMDGRTGKLLWDVYGSGFAAAPDGSAIAHFGILPHVSERFRLSSYVQLSGKTVYPPKGPEAIVQKGRLWSGVHEMEGPLKWSPDAKRVAFIDCTYDFKASKDEPVVDDDGERLNERCFAVAVTKTGGAKTLEVDHPVPLTWRDATHLMVGEGGRAKVLSVD